jgi:hypothetical protein
VSMNESRLAFGGQSVNVEELHPFMNPVF